MKWFKHLTKSKSDPDIMESEILFKAKGPYVFWRLLEIISYEDAIDTPLIMNFKVFKMWFPSVTVNRLITILSYFQDKNRIIFEIIDTNIKISCTKLSEISSDYIAKVRRMSEQSSKHVRKISTLDLEVDKDRDKYTKEKSNKKEPTWRDDFEIYKELVNNALVSILEDPEEMDKQQTYNPNLEIKLSLEKSIHNFWGTEAGWKHKKKSRAKEINMRSTLINNISRNPVKMVWNKAKDSEAEWKKKRDEFING